MDDETGIHKLSAEQERRATMKKSKLIISAVTKYLEGIILVGLLVFLPAGTLDYWNGWLFAGLLFLPMLVLGVVLFAKAPELLEKRLRSKEKESEQKGVILVSALVFIAGFILAGLDYRFGWSKLPLWLVIVAAVLFVISYGLYGEVMRENAYLSRTVEVQEGQKVIDTGLYGIVRHPMYAVTVLMYLSMPLVLGSAVAFLVFLIYPVLLVFRIRNEEAVLEQGLASYKEYKQKVRYRLIPFIW